MYYTIMTSLKTKAMKYYGLKEVDAEPMTAEIAEGKGYRTGHHHGTDEGYEVVYGDGYRSWCPKAPFETAYRATAGIDFSRALVALKQGKKVTRRGWNGKGMFLWLKPAAVIRSEWCKDPELKSLVDENGGEIQALGTICMYTHDSTGRKAILTGWLASQSDMLCEDWEIIE